MEDYNLLLDIYDLEFIIGVSDILELNDYHWQEKEPKELKVTELQLSKLRQICYQNKDYRIYVNEQLNNDSLYIDWTFACLEHYFNINPKWVR